MVESKFYTWRKDGNKMIINSDFKTFNKQTNYIGTGNVIANTMTGFYIRPYNEIECNGTYHEKGVLRDNDLKMFEYNKDIFDYVKSITENKSCILYQIFYYKNNKKRKVFGYIIQQNNDFKYILTDYENRDKKRSALDLVVNILKEKNLDKGV